MLWQLSDKEAGILIKEADLEVDFENKFTQLINSKEKQKILGEILKN